MEPMRIMTIVTVAFVVFTAMAACERSFSDQNLPDWNIQYGIHSAWGAHHGVRIWSDGQTAVCTNYSCNQYSVCSSLRASPTMLYTLGELILKIPEPESGESIIKLPNQCHDNSVQIIRAEVGGKPRGFTYAMAEACRRDVEVPDWMVETAELMRGHLDWIVGCQKSE
jgi:hypothetical protein